MSRPITEIHDFTNEQVAAILKGIAKAQIIGGFYCGEFGEQTIEVYATGFRVTTTHHAEDFDSALRRHRRA